MSVSAVHFVSRTWPCWAVAAEYISCVLLLCLVCLVFCAADAGCATVLPTGSHSRSSRSTAATVGPQGSTPAACCAQQQWCRRQHQHCNSSAAIPAGHANSRCAHQHTTTTTSSNTRTSSSSRCECRSHRWQRKRLRGCNSNLSSCVLTAAVSALDPWPVIHQLRPADSGVPLLGSCTVAQVRVIKSAGLPDCLWPIFVQLHQQPSCGLHPATRL